MWWSSWLYGRTYVNSHSATRIFGCLSNKCHSLQSNRTWSSFLFQSNYFFFPVRSVWFCVNGKYFAIIARPTVYSSASLKTLFDSSNIVYAANRVLQGKFHKKRSVHKSTLPHALLLRISIGVKLKPSNKRW